MARFNRLNKDRWDRFLDEGLEIYLERRQMVEDDALRDGVPPFTEPLSEPMAYRRLLEMRQAGIPEAFSSEAEEDFQRFRRKYGSGPFGPQPQTGPGGPQAVPPMPMSAPGPVPPNGAMQP